MRTGIGGHASVGRVERVNWTWLCSGIALPLLWRGKFQRFHLNFRRSRVLVSLFTL